MCSSQEEMSSFTCSVVEIPSAVGGAKRKIRVGMSLCTASFTHLEASMLPRQQSPYYI